jgi:Ricin-type beta-trefoil lectin domain-like
MKNRIVTFLAALTVMLGGLVALAPAPASAAALFGPYQLRLSDDTSKCVDITGVSQANGAYAQLYDCLGAQQYNQQFYFYAVSGLFQVYQIVAVHSGKCLDVEGASQSAGARIQQYDCLGYGQTNQLWGQVTYGAYSALYAQHSSRAMSTYSIYNGSPIVQRSVNTLWYLTIA